jgi:radical SAM protein with 4Fe4S-binding SPASM domain
MPKQSLGNLVLELTTRCNQDCRYCYNIWKCPHASTPRLDYVRPRDYRQTKRTLRRLFRQALIGRVTLSGGEPLLADRFPELVLFIRLHHASVTVISNGSVAPVREYQTLTDLGVDLFEFTVNSDLEKEHDYLTRTPGSWKRTTRLIAELAGGKTEVVCVVVLTRVNVGRIASTLRFIHGLGISRVMLNRYNLGGAGIANPGKLQVSANELHETLAVAEGLSVDLGLRLSANVCTPWCVVNPKDYPIIAMGSCGSSADGMPVTVSASGDVRLCNHSPVVIGNVHATTLNKILSGPTAGHFFGSVPNYCAECALYDSCRGGCRAVSEQLRISLTAHDPVATAVRH